ncbi:stability protein [Vibrio natriegens]|uniref:StbB family protein n=1 Tax=Vibrio natriegens TaxID=691 RepID=UPI0008041EA1|nr:StbB family protein [Vibrio natriegens]ANQ23750.1 stability protein [Vibrio natriegens]
MDYIKIAVLNNSGNVGKSTICNTLLIPRIENSELIRVETINEDGSSGEKLAAKDMTNIIERIDILDKAIIDIGSSNIETFIKGIKENIGAHEDIDFYLLPVTPDIKQQKDTWNTIDELLDMEVEPNRIGVILNRVDTSLPLESQFKQLYESGILKQTATPTIQDCLVIPDSQVFTLLEVIGSSFHEAVNDDTDYRKVIREAKDKETRSGLSLKKSCHRLAKSFADKLDVEYKKLVVLLD